MKTHQRAVSLFLSYAHEDEPLLRELKTHLRSLKRQGLISMWDDREILPGTDWAGIIDTRLLEASIILLLVSANFLASDYCYEVEMNCALERHKAGEALVIPIVIRPVDWKDAPFAHLKVLPTDGKAITTWTNLDKAFVDVVSGIRRAIEDLSQLPASTSRTALPPIWNIPYPRNSFFLGRDDLLEQLHTRLQTGQATALSQSAHAISGLGGIGKTQVATEYAYRYSQDYEVVLWAHAESEEALITSYTTIATLLRLPEREEKEVEVITQAVKMWLQTHQKWLLILDNADDLDVVPPFLPPVSGGHVLLTTRAWDMQRLATRVEVDVLSDAHGAELLLRRAGLLTAETAFGQASLEDRQCATHLTQELGGLPLALDQAGAYLEATGMSVQEYQEIYRTHQQTLLRERRSRVPDHPEAVATIWSLSFALVRAKNPAAAELLQLCAFLSPDAIPEEIITKGFVHFTPTLQSVATNPLVLNEAIELLRTFSLVRRNATARTLSIHRLVQAVFKASLGEDIRHQWAEISVRVVNQVFPDVEFATWSSCERYLSHAGICATLIKEWNMEFLEAAQLLHRVAFYLQERAQYTEAESLYTLSLRTFERVLGPEHPAVTKSLNDLAWLYRTEGKYTESELLYQNVLEIRRKTLGSQHPEVAQSLNRLARLYRTQGKYIEAETLLTEALTVNEQALGLEHLKVAQSLTDLARLYLDLGKYVQAELLLTRTLSIREKALGSTHPDIVRTINILGRLYTMQGKYVQAESLLLRALSIRETTIGPDHHDVAYVLNWLALLYNLQGKYVQAERLHNRARAIWEQTLGPEHPHVAYSLNSLAELYHLQGRYEQAEPLLIRALDIREKNFGANHADVADCLNNLGKLYCAQGRYTQAEIALMQALNIREKTLGSEHPDVAQCLNSLGELYCAQGRYEQTEPLFQRALGIREQQLGPEHPDTAQSRWRLAFLAQWQGKYAQAKSFYEQALAIYEQRLGPEHPDTQALQEEYTALCFKMASEV